jgi:NAD(P)-dependent dehydrogenase (short-subunit alcohol dehydrogenase family)
MIIVITGVTRGLGRAMAERFAESGHVVLGCGRSQEAVEELRSVHSGSHEFDTVDVADSAQVDAWAARLLERWGPPDYLINNAGLINRNARLWEVPSEEFSAVVDVNVKGTANTIRTFAPAMVERGTGVIVNFSSGWGRSAAPEVAPYCATKWAIEGMTRALAHELPLGMAAVTLNPGVIDTEMLRSCLPDSAPRCPTPEEWSRRAVPFLLRIQAADNGSALTAP